MILAVRGIVISLALFVVVYGAISCVMLLTWQKLWSLSRRFSAQWRADVLFGLRMLPFIAAILLVAAYAVPSFVAFEPRSLQERISGITLALSAMGFALAVFALGRSMAALRRAARVIAEWTRGAHSVQIGHPVSLLEVSGCAPAMIAAGIVRPKVLLSQAARSLLSMGELRAALNHELVHVRRRDNLKKLFLHLVAFPGMSALEKSWLDATELAADENAVSNSAEALDLASALIKLSRLAVPMPPAELTAALVHTPAALVDARVKRLIGWQDHPRVQRQQSLLWYGICAGMATLALLIFSYGPLLVRVHEITEWMVR